MKVHVRILSILISSTVAAMASAAQRDQEQGTAAIPPAQAAEDQAAALKMAKTQDLPLLEKADRAVIDHVLPVREAHQHHRRRGPQAAPHGAGGPRRAAQCGRERVRDFLLSR